MLPRDFSGVICNVNPLLLTMCCNSPVIVCCDDEAWMDNSDRMGRGERTLLMGCGRVASRRSQDPVSSFPNTNVAMCVDYPDFIIIIIITTVNRYKLQETVSSLHHHHHAHKCSHMGGPGNFLR